MGAEVVLAPLGVVHTHVASVLWYLGYYRNKTEDSETKPSKVHIDYVKDAVVDTWSSSSDSEEDE